MPLDKPKPPNHYPPDFHQALSRGEGECLVTLCTTEAEAKSTARKFRAFLRGLKDFPLHPTSQRMVGLEARTRCSLGPYGWQMAVVVNRKTIWEGVF